MPRPRKDPAQRERRVRYEGEEGYRAPRGQRIFTARQVYELSHDEVEPGSLTWTPELRDRCIAAVASNESLSAEPAARALLRRDNPPAGPREQLTAWLRDRVEASPYRDVELRAYREAK